MDIGIFGGAFDPVHIGHLILAEQCRFKALLNEIWFLPSYHSPHKADKVVVRFEQRCDMLELAIAGHASFRVERIEKELPSPSFTVQTLAELQKRYPRNNFSLIIGADNLPDLPSWFEPTRILELAQLLVVPRPDSVSWSDLELSAALGIERERIRMTLIDSPLIDLSSRKIRRVIGERGSVRYQIPRAVEEYIRERKLYGMS